MSVSLCCPNCGREVGIADSSDGYKEKYFYKNNKEEPVCPNCGTGDDNIMKYIFIGAFALILLIPILMFLTS